MAHDDMHVVMYKILSYLYKCMKAGESPDLRMVGADALGINHKYWSAIVDELVERGYVKGFKVTEVPGLTPRCVTPVDPAITMSGVEFLMENSMMRKAYAFLRDAKDALPFL